MAVCAGSGVAARLTPAHLTGYPLSPSGKPTRANVTCPSCHRRLDGVRVVSTDHGIPVTPFARIRKHAR